MANASVAAVVFKNHHAKEEKEHEELRQQAAAANVIKNVRLAHATSIRDKGKGLDEALAAKIIQQMWRKKNPGPLLRRTVFVDRLHLEDELCKGLVRLLGFLAMFFLLIFANSLSVPSSYRLDTATMLGDALNLEDWNEVRTLESLRDFIPELSANLKVFGVATSQRFPDPQSMELLDGKGQEFVAPVTIQSTDPPVTVPAWTLMAWVKSLPTLLPRRSIVRKLVAANPTLSCWGWFHPATLAFGAHDYHTLTPEQTGAWEETVTGGGTMPTGWSHEAIVVEGRNITFYRNGELLKKETLPRTLTQCRGIVEMGDADLGLSAVKFYGRALKFNEISEIYTGGQPLSELITGSSVAQSRRDPLEQAIAATNQGTDTVSKDVSDHNIRAIINSAAKNNKLDQLLNPQNDPNFPEDLSPAASLMSGTADASIRSAMIATDRERQHWVAGGSPTNDLVQGTAWEADGAGTYWHLLKNIVYAGKNDVPIATIPAIPAGTRAFTITYWVKPFDPFLRNDCNIIMSPYGNTSTWSAGWTNSGTRWRWIDGGHWFQTAMWFSDTIEGRMLVRDDGVRFADSNDYVMSFQESTTGNGLDEKYLPTGRSQEPGPTAWRYYAVSYDWNSGSVTHWIDGKKNFDSVDGGHRVRDKLKLDPAQDPVPVLSGMKMNTHCSEHCSVIQNKIGDIRFYTSALTEAQQLTAMRAGTWSNDVKQQQCVEADSDNSYADKNTRDSSRHTCLWYAQMKLIGPEVCSTPQAKILCPVTCAGKKECHNGNTKFGYVPPVKPKKFRVWNRVMFLRPKPTRSLICLGKSVNKADVLKECRRVAAAGEVPANSNSPDWYKFKYGLSEVWPLVGKADITDCAVLEARMDDVDQCTWDDSWISEFKTQREATPGRFYSMSWFAKATPGSYGMPGTFWQHVSLISQLAPAYTLADVSEQAPQREDQLRVWYPAPTGGTAQQQPLTGSVDYRDWSFYYTSTEDTEPYRGDARSRICIALNNFPQLCRTVPRLTEPEAFLQAVELTTEGMMSPVEFSTEKLSTSQIQNLFYVSARKFELIPGPSEVETERVEKLSKIEKKETVSYDEKLALLSPPVLFQSRVEKDKCSQDIATTFLSAQMNLISATHCTKTGMCPEVSGADDVYTCDGKDTPTATYFGLNVSSLDGQKGYTELLYSVADNTVLVRDNKQLSTRLFVDGRSKNVKMLATFQSPQNGLTTLLTMTANIDGPMVDTSAEILHLGYLDEGGRQNYIQIVACQFALMGLLLIFNLAALLLVFNERKESPEDGWDVAAIAEVAYDLMQIVVIAAFCAVSMPYLLDSENKAKEIIGELISVPFADSNVSFSEKIAQLFSAVEGLLDAFRFEAILANFSFACLMLMLVRIVYATAVHPRTGVLTGTIMKGLDDMCHFGLLFLLVFVTFSYTAFWMFGGDNRAFKDLGTSMTTQFDILLGALPEDFRDDVRMIAYVVFTNVVMFFLMLNFLLAIVVESYLKVREQIEANEAENTIVEDVAITFHHWIKSRYVGWPSLRKLQRIVEKKISSNAVSVHNLVVMGVPQKQASNIIYTYNRLDCLQHREPKDQLFKVSKPGKPAPPAEEFSNCGKGNNKQIPFSGVSSAAGTPGATSGANPWQQEDLIPFTPSNGASTSFSDSIKYPNGRPMMTPGPDPAILPTLPPPRRKLGSPKGTDQEFVGV
mmetsp:Transcript_924/g.2032  ORF Transcript_924/g.2032 Transcript_924/m.2032 type:complete len:1682 (-) Transcript_924:65-5110(-)